MACTVVFVTLLVVTNLSVCSLSAILYLLVPVSVTTLYIHLYSVYFQHEKILDPQSNSSLNNYQATVQQLSNSCKQICYYIQIPLDETSAPTSLPLNCSVINGSELESVDCLSYSWGRVLDVENDGVCNPMPYSGSLCRQLLLAWQECAVRGAEDVLLDLTFGELSQEERERDVSQFLYFLHVCKLSHAYTVVIKPEIAIAELVHSLGSFGSEYCQRAASLVACQSYFPRCDCNNGYLYLASREECERISMTECDEEWTSARQYGIHLPNCTELQEEVTSEDHH